MALSGEGPKKLASIESAWWLLERWGVTAEPVELERSAAWRFPLPGASRGGLPD
jgi:hypothetical protein